MDAQNIRHYWAAKLLWDKLSLLCRHFSFKHSSCILENVLKGNLSFICHSTILFCSNFHPFLISFCSAFDCKPKILFQNGNFFTVKAFGSDSDTRDHFFNISKAILPIVQITLSTWLSNSWVIPLEDTSFGVPHRYYCFIFLQKIMEKQFAKK